MALTYYGIKRTYDRADTSKLIDWIPSLRADIVRARPHRALRWRCE